MKKIRWNPEVTMQLSQEIWKQDICLDHIYLKIIEAIFKQAARVFNELQKKNQTEKRAE